MNTELKMNTKLVTFCTKALIRISKSQRPLVGNILCLFYPIWIYQFWEFHHIFCVRPQWFTFLIF